VAKREPARRDAIAVLKQDHREIERLFKEFERSGEKEQRKKKRVVKQIIEQLSMHGQLEEQLFYPQLQETAKEKEPALKAMEEHDLIKVLLGQLETMSPEKERFQAKVTVLIESVRSHVKEEEAQLFPKLREALTPIQLKDLGTRLEEGRKAIQSPRDYLSMNPGQ
jgi:hemerythrin superfamily protein